MLVSECSAGHAWLVSRGSTAYCVDRDIVDRAEAERACRAVLDVVLPRVRTVWVGAYSDEVDLPPEVREAQAALFRLGEDRGRADPGMGIELYVERPDQVRLLRVFAQWSINVELYDEAMRWVADLHDCGYSVCFSVTEDEVSRISSGLGDLPVATLKQVRARRNR